MLKAYIKAKDLMTQVKSNEGGASLAEYALIIALVLIGAAIAIGILTTQVNGAITDGAGVLETARAAPTV